MIISGGLQSSAQTWLRGRGGVGGFNHFNPLLTIPAYAIGRRFIRPSEIPPTISTNLEMQGNFLTF